MRRLLGEPLVHFLLIGAALFVALDLRRPSEAAPSRIVVTKGTLDAIAAGFEERWRRPPTPEEMDGLIAEEVREEIYGREARTRGLDRDDPVIRRRLRQKLELIAEDRTVGLEPTDDDLRRYFAAHAGDFTGVGGIPPTFAASRDAVLRAWMAAKRREADEAYDRELLGKYDVVIER